LYLMVFLKLPIVALFFIVRWAIRQAPEMDQPRGDGGIKRPRNPHAHDPLRRPRCRGPHGGAVPPSPARVRTSVVRVRSREL
jgi:hypothetical protein